MIYRGNRQTLRRTHQLSVFPYKILKQAPNFKISNTFKEP